MIEIPSRLKSVTDRGKWAGRGGLFVARAKATKAVWFPPKPVESGKKASSAAKKTAKKATKKSTGAAKKTPKGAKNVTNRVRRKKT